MANRVPNTYNRIPNTYILVINTVDQSDLGRFDLAVKSMASRATTRRVWPDMRW